MRNDANENRTESPGTAVFRRMRSPRRLPIEAAQSILFDVDAFKLDRKLGLPEHNAVERNLSIVNAWPDILS